MIDLHLALRIHSILIKQYGGSAGVRDLNSVESAINRPYSTFGGNDLYPTVIEKAAAIAESIIKNHPFIDGNKRTGYALMLLTLMDQNIDILVGEDAKYDFVIQIASGQLDFNEIVIWIKQNCTYM
ncbi:MAG: type II toxin-antitoxin system death-on-curing family toxin [Bacteroidota bacterium]